MAGLLFVRLRTLLRAESKDGELLDIDFFLGLPQQFYLVPTMCECHQKEIWEVGNADYS